MDTKIENIKMPKAETRMTTNDSLNNEKPLYYMVLIRKQIDGLSDDE